MVGLMDLMWHIEFIKGEHQDIFNNTHEKQVPVHRMCSTLNIDPISQILPDFFCNLVMFIQHFV